MMVRGVPLLLALTCAISCQGNEGAGNGTTDGPLDKRFECNVCDELQAAFEFEQNQADEAGCLDHGGGVNPAVTCTIDGVEYQQQVLHFERCERAPRCVDDAPGGQGGATNYREPDYACFTCDESTADSYHDEGVEEAGCGQSSIRVNPDADCFSAGEALNIFFWDCEGVPPCAPLD